MELSDRQTDGGNSHVSAHGTRYGGAIPHSALLMVVQYNNLAVCLSISNNQTTAPIPLKQKTLSSPERRVLWTDLFFMDWEIKKAKFK